MRFLEKTQHGRGKSIFQIFLVSYLIILTIPLVIGSINYFKSSDVVKEEAVKYNKVILDQIRQSIDNQLQAIYELTADIALNNRTQNLQSKTDVYDPGSINEMVLLTQDISHDFNLNPFLDYIYLYLRKSDIILTNSVKYQPKFFYEQELSYAGINYIEWKNLLNSYQCRKFLPAEIINDTRGPYGVITYICSLPIGSRGNNLATLVILIKEKKIKDLLVNIGTIDQGALYILDQENQIITSVGNKDLLTAKVRQKFPVTAGTFYQRINGRNMAIQYTKSEFSNWKYVSLIPTKIFMNKVNYIRSLTLGVFLLSLVAGLVAAYLLATRNYKPIKMMVSNLSEEVGMALSKDNNEYDMIKIIFNDIIDKKKKFREALDGHIQVLKYYYPNDIESRLIKCAKTGDIGETRKILNQIFEHNLANGGMTLELARCLFFDIVCTAIKVVNGIEGTHLLQRDFDPVGFLARCETIAEMEKVIFDIFERLCGFINDVNQKQHNQRLVTRIREYISCNYHDTALSLSAIADAMSLTPSYTSRLFKERTGQGIVDYINLVRIEQAKKLLQQENVLITDVALQVGYLSDDTFIKAFRKYEGHHTGKIPGDRGESAKWAGQHLVVPPRRARDNKR